MECPLATKGNTNTYLKYAAVKSAHSTT